MFYNFVFNKSNTFAILIFCAFEIKKFALTDLLKLSVGKFMYSFYNSGFPNFCDNYFTEIASVHKCQTRLAALQKHYFPRMKTFQG